MEIKETIEFLSRYLDNEHYTNKCNKAHQIAISALEKQIPFKPKEYEDKFYSCKCGNVLMMKWEKYNTKLIPKSEGLPYCLNCGQRLDWSEP
jgi:hypothetical protein